MTYDELTFEELSHMSGGRATHVIVTQKGETIQVKQRDQFNNNKEYKEYIKRIEKKIGIGTGL